MNEVKKTEYQKRIAVRSRYQYLRGLLPRYINHVRNSYFVWLARRRGATIGDCVTLPYELAKLANSNLSIGHHSSIQTARIDTRAEVRIGNHVIIGADVEIITVSHDVDSPDWEHKKYGIVIEDYCWLSTRSFILPSCQRVEYGAVCAAGSVVARNIARMEIVAGNPAKHLRARRSVHSDLCVESMLGNDYLAYVEAYRK